MVSALRVALGAALCACATAASPAPPAPAPHPRTLRRLVGGHIKLQPDKHQHSYGDPSKNSFAFDEKTSLKGDGRDRGVWDDGMLMSSAGDGKDRAKEEDEDKKTLSDQVAEGKYGLIQNEIFQKAPKRPGVLSYEANPDTRDQDNVHTLGGLDKDEIWLAEDHLLVLKGGAFPERGQDEREPSPWPPIDAYEAPRRQVKLPQKPAVPPPFPVRLTDDGPLVFLTPNGSVPAALFPAFPPGAGDGPLPPAPFPFPPPPGTAGGDPGNLTAGRAPYPVPPFPFLPGNSSEGVPYPFPFPPSLNGTFPEGFPPGAAFLPPPGNQTDLYDEDDPSIYYPPPYNFSYRAESESSVPAGPLVPGIVLPPPPDFFAPLEEMRTTEETDAETTPKYKPAAKRPYSTVYARKQKPKPVTTEDVNTIEVTTTRPIIVEDSPVLRQPPRVVQIPRPAPVRPLYVKGEPVTRPEKPIYSPRPKTTLKPVSVVYDYAQPAYTPPSSSAKPFEIYGLPQKTSHIEGNSIVTSTPVPLRAYYTNVEDNYPKTELKPVYPLKQKEKSVASFYFFDEQPKTTPAPSTYFDGRNYYKTVPRFNPQTETGFTPSVNVAYGSIDQSDNLLLWPQKQGPRTLTQEYFSIQKPKTQQVYIQQNGRPDTFLQQIADIQQTIDYFTTNRPKYQRLNYKTKPTVRPVYQYSYQSKPRQEHITFRAPKLDTEPFRPMVSYSKPFNAEDYNTISPSPSPLYHQQYLVENVKVTTETPTSTKYYPKANTKDQDYEDVPRDEKKNYKPPQRTQTQSPQVSYPATTPSAVEHGYYTKQDERYVDDITKNYFEAFGKKIEEQDNGGIAVTPSLQPVRTPINNAINLQYDDEAYRKPNAPSLADDTLVNYRKPRPYVNPDSEFIPIANPAYQQIAQIHQILQQPPQQSQHHIPSYTAEQLELFRPIPPPSLAGDINVNYNRPLPINPDAEFIEPVNAAGEGRPGSFVSYRLPGEGAHVYFLTPQATRDRYGYRPRAGR